MLSNFKASLAAALVYCGNVLLVYALGTFHKDETLMKDFCLGRLVSLSFVYSALK